MTFSELLPILAWALAPLLCLAVIAHEFYVYRTRVRRRR